jgi:organic radical activating enzyme
MDDIKDSKVFCVLPWVHLCASVDGVWGRCCNDGAMYHDDLYEQKEEPEFALKPDAIGCLPRSRYARSNPDRAIGLEEAFNSPTMRRTRLAMLAGEKVEACAYCYAREEGGGQSYRQTAGALISSEEADVPALVARTAPDGTLDSSPVYLDLRFGNSCNLQCVMCGYPISSKWGLAAHPSWAPAHVDPYREDEALWESLRRNAGTFRRLYFAGGEPFMQPGHFRMIDLMIELDRADQIRLAYNSNLTIMPDGLFDKLSRFRSVEIGASCDGVGPVFEQIRVGGKWDVFVRNLRFAKEHADVWLAVAPQRDNIFHLRDIVEFGSAEGVRADFSNFVHWPKHLSVRNLPDEEKVRAAAYLRALVDDCGDEGTARQLDMLRIFVGQSRLPN